MRAMISRTTLAVAAVYLFMVGPGSSHSAKMNHLQILDSLLKKNYDRRATPTNHLSGNTMWIYFTLAMGIIWTIVIYGIRSGLPAVLRTAQYVWFVFVVCWVYVVAISFMDETGAYCVARRCPESFWVVEFQFNQLSMESFDYYDHKQHDLTKPADDYVFVPPVLPTDNETTPIVEKANEAAESKAARLWMAEDFNKYLIRAMCLIVLFHNATTVHCELYIRSFGSISPVTMDYEVDLYLRQKWQDARLKHPEITESLDLNDPNLVKAIWKPEVYFPNAKHAEFQFVTVPNVLIRIKPDGDILYMLRLKLTFSCMMDLSKFPLDNQICTMEVASFSKTIEELRLEWKNTDPVLMAKGLRMPQFEIVNIVPSDCQESFQIGNYSCLVAQFYLSRSVGFHLVQSYLPTMLIVVISWVSFWMDVDSVPGRTTLGVTTLLAVGSQSSGIQSGLPQVSYVKAIDVWMGTCTAFVFCALLEFTVVNYMWRKLRPDILRNILTEPVNGGTAGSKSYDENIPSSPVIPVSVVKKILQQECAYSSSVDTNTVLARKIDEYSRLLFPVAFIAFNALYWPYYLQK